MTAPPAIAATVVAMAVVIAAPAAAFAKETPMPIVRLAELEIDPAHLDAYQTRLREEIATSIASEPGVQAIYAVAEKDRPTHLHLLEIYADQAAYEAHLKSPHFLAYKQGTQTMVLSLKLIEATPVALGAKPAP